MRLSIARDIYSEHYDDLSEQQKGRIVDFAALRMLENEELNKITNKDPNLSED